ncbi:MAG: transketolase [Phycisphaerae bacterium]
MSAAATAAGLAQKAADLGKLAVRMTTLAGSGHPTSSLSLAHIVTELLYHEMCYDPGNPWHPAADRLVLSEGHAVPIVYAAWADLGGVVGKSREESRKLTIADVDALRAVDSELDGHPNPAEGFPFFDAATGSLGMGLSVAAGLALAARLDGTKRRVYCIVGDGESREGQIWEAIDFITDNNLTNVCTFINSNNYGQAGPVSAQQDADITAAKLRAFGWEAVIIDGHNPDEIRAALKKFHATKKPFGIVANTIKGWGVEKFLDGGNWHGKVLPEADLDEAYASLDRAAESMSDVTALGEHPFPAPANVQRNDVRGLEWPSFEQAMKDAGFGGAVAKGKLATRRAYGATLHAAGKILSQVVALDGDVSNSTFSEVFRKDFEKRFVECKIAEQNMVSLGVGFSAAGFIPFVNSFSKFIARGYDQVELANITRANLKIVGSHSGISLAADGPSQMSVADVAFFRAYSTVKADDRESPLCWIYQPADAVATFELTKLMTAQPGMAYMRTFRPDVPLLYSPETKFEERGFHVLKQGHDLALVTCGFMVHIALEAARELAKQNRHVAVIDAYCMPTDADRMAETLERCGRRALVVEDNYGSGLGSEIAEIAAATGCARVKLQHVNKMPKSARSEEVILDYCGVSAKQVADHANALLNG